MSTVLADLHIADVSGSNSLQFENEGFLQQAQLSLLFFVISTAFVVPSMIKLLGGNILDMVNVIEV